MSVDATVELMTVDTWAGLRQLAVSTNQTLSPSFIRSLLRRKSGVRRSCKYALSPDSRPDVHTHSSVSDQHHPGAFCSLPRTRFFSLSLARLPFFRRPAAKEDKEDPIDLQTLLMGPSTIPLSPDPPVGSSWSRCRRRARNGFHPY